MPEFGTQPKGCIQRLSRANFSLISYKLLTITILRVKISNSPYQDWTLVPFAFTKEENKLVQKKAYLPKLASTMQGSDIHFCTKKDIHVRYQLKMVCHLLAQYLLPVLHFILKLLRE